MGGGQGCCGTSFSAQTALHSKELPVPQMSVALSLRNLAIVILGDTLLIFLLLLSYSNSLSCASVVLA